MNKQRKIKPIAECCDILDNLRVPINDEVRQTRQGNIPYYGANGIQGFIDDYIFDEDLILLAEDGGNFEEYNTRPIAYKISGKSWVNNHAHILRAKLYFNQDYIFYSLVHKDITKYLNSGTRSKLNKSELQKIEIEFPSTKTEEEKIAKILSTADAVIEKTQSAIAKYKAIKQGMLQDLFTRGIDITTNQLRPKYEDAPHLYKESKLGWIPREWDEEKLEEIGDIVTGSTPPTARSEYYGNEFLFVSPADIQDNYFVHNTGKKLTQSGFDVTRKLPENSICVVCIGSTIGKMALLVKEGCTNQQINTVICFDIEMSFYFFYAMMLHNEPQFRKETGLQAVPIVNKSQFSKFLVPVAGKIEALIISERLTAIDNKLQTEQAYLQKMQLLKKGLMEDLLSGRKKVNVDEELVTQDNKEYGRIHSS
jgi:type I restriction enzyme S subunit